MVTETLFNAYRSIVTGFENADDIGPLFYLNTEKTTMDSVVSKQQFPLFCATYNSLSGTAMAVMIRVSFSSTGNHGSYDCFLLDKPDDKGNAVILKKESGFFNSDELATLGALLHFYVDSKGIKRPLVHKLMELEKVVTISDMFRFEQEMSTPRKTSKSSRSDNHQRSGGDRFLVVSIYEGPNDKTILIGCDNPRFINEFGKNMVECSASGIYQNLHMISSWAEKALKMKCHFTIG